ncbi:hypothetical protein FNV43_RR11132 [Rhamnella rubrinervis]|uniref:Uncharacterized protein n=1 Tax=Rhamnella rubrinervis TaxID=2594499 RepID=A0A8K0MHK4_9ROSA|nr:hypothetical protein FNV43_RR11132 [Rhamnella rubrinervis]
MSTIRFDSSLVARGVDKFDKLMTIHAMGVSRTTPQSATGESSFALVSTEVTIPTLRVVFTYQEKNDELKRKSLACSNGIEPEWFKINLEDEHNILGSRRYLPAFMLGSSLSAFTSAIDSSNESARDGTILVLVAYLWGKYHPPVHPPLLVNQHPPRPHLVHLCWKTSLQICYHRLHLRSARSGPIGFLSLELTDHVISNFYGDVNCSFAVDILLFACFKLSLLKLFGLSINLYNHLLQTEFVLFKYFSHFYDATVHHRLLPKCIVRLDESLEEDVSVMLSHRAIHYWSHLVRVRANRRAVFKSQALLGWYQHKVASSSSATLFTNDDGAVPSKRNDEDEDLLNQCFEILNTMDEIDGDSYSKAIKLLYDDVT